ncbi:MAG: sigma-70 family RNA polymerase sigma factor [Planctomycetales bacterium]|nr:sigma-70 family RNA polymerase sigma factor [Planctomycetales bacterium]
MDLTQILESANSGDDDARLQLIQAAYDELKRIATARMRNQRLDHTLGATAMVNEAALKRLNETNLGVENSPLFFAYVSRAMRNLLIDHARAKGRQKRCGERNELTLDEAVVACENQSEDFLALNDALDRFAELKPRCAQVVEMRYFGGMSNQEVADDHVAEGATRNKFQYRKSEIIMIANVVKRDDIWMRQRCNRFDFSLKPSSHIWAGCACAIENLNGNVSTQPRINSSKHFAHSAGAYWRLHDVPSCQRHAVNELPVSERGASRVLW